MGTKLLKKWAKVLADRLADSTFWGLADKLADSWRIKTPTLENPVTMRVCGVVLVADKLADIWRGPIRQSATPFRVADRGGRVADRVQKLHKMSTTIWPSKAVPNITMM
jgi:hypothetical protein